MVHQENHSLLHLPSSRQPHWPLGPSLIKTTTLTSCTLPCQDLIKTTTLTSCTLPHQDNHTNLLHPPSSRQPHWPLAPSLIKTTTLTSCTLPHQDNHIDLLHPPSSKNHTDLLHPPSSRQPHWPLAPSLIKTTTLTSCTLPHQRTTLTSCTLPHQDNHTDLLHPPSSKNHTDLLDVWRPVPPSAIRCCCWWWCSCCDVSGNKWTHQTWQSLSAENNTLHLWGQLWRVTQVTKRAVSVHCNSTHKHKVFNTDSLPSSLWDCYGGCKCKCFWSKWIHQAWLQSPKCSYNQDCQGTL